jgi:hypothetical protein
MKAIITTDFFKHVALYIFCLFFLSNCKKFVEVDVPKTQIPSSLVFSDDKSANSAVAGMYSYMYQLNNANSTFGGWHLTICTALSADELTRPAVPSDQFLTNKLTADNGDISSMWQSCYTILYNANAIIEGLQQSAGISTPYKKQLTGEALFIRAFVNFYLVNLFGDVPLITTTAVTATQSVGRTDSSDMYKQIMSDLLQARDLLVSDYSFSNNERVRVNKFAATAFLARVYLYQRSWVNAEAEATTVIKNSTLYNLLPDLTTVFLKNSKEAIWQFYSFGGDGHTTVGAALIPTSTTTVPNFTLNKYLLGAFDSADQRKSKWTTMSVVNGQTYYYPSKYKQRLATTSTTSTTGEYDMALRFGEQYLIRAEARAQQGNINGAQADLNIIRARAGLPPTSANNQTTLIAAIEKERQTELFVEWGHRWLDLKRTGRINDVLGMEKVNWVASFALYPIPSVELNKNVNLTQNPDY